MQTTLANEDLSALAAFSAAPQPFKELSSAGSPLPFSIIIAFLAVAQRDGAGAFQLGKDLGMSQGSLSRNCRNGESIHAKKIPAIAPTAQNTIKAT
jgi:hypothetical protein